MSSFFSDEIADNILFEIIKRFQIDNEPQRVQALKKGHIHRSYMVFCSRSQQPDYILQQINHNVFTQPDLLQQNIHRVIEHLQRKIEKSPKSLTLSAVSQLIPSQTGDFYMNHPILSNRKNMKEKQWWRLFQYIPNSSSFDMPENLKQVEQSGAIFGKFFKFMADFPPERLHRILPGFHHLDNYWQKFQQAVELDVLGRKSKIPREIARIKEVYPIMNEIHKKISRLPPRISHNDPKFSNILFDSRNNAVSVIDLDTVASGYAFFDFGDGARSICNEAAEDEEDLGLVDFNLERFRIFSQGFLGNIQPLLNSEEQDLLPFAPAYFAFMLGIRFLTDFLYGDKYFHISKPEHNLIRAKVQIALCMKFMEKKAFLIKQFQEWKKFDKR